MELEEALNIAKEEFLNNIEEDSVRYNNITQRLFEQSCRWDKTFLERFEASLASADIERCIPGTPGCIREEGYIPKELLLSLFRCMLEIYARKSNGQYADFNLSGLYSEIVILYNMIKLMKHSENNNSLKHVAFVKIFFTESFNENRIVCYHAGYPDHSIYINYFRYSDKLYALTCNLGEGIDRHTSCVHYDGKRLVWPVLLEITDLDRHLTCIYNANTYKEDVSSYEKQELINSIYNSGIVTEDQYLPEIAQRTGNCVVKNYMHAMACRIMNNKDYLDIFTCIRSVLGSHLTQEYNYIYKRDVTHLNRSLSTSQTLCAGATCEDLQNLPLHIPVPVTRTVNHHSAIDQTTARVVGGALGAGAGILISYHLLKNKNLSTEKKFIIILVSGLSLGIIGERLGNAISQPHTSKETIYKDSEVSASNLTICREVPCAFNIIITTPLMFHRIAESRSGTPEALPTSSREDQGQHRRPERKKRHQPY